MDRDRRLDAHLAQSLDELLSLASAAVAEGRPELALAANAALDRLLPFVVAGASSPATDCPPETAGARPHAEH